MAEQEDKFLRLKTVATDILSQSGNCIASQETFAATRTIRDICDAWYKYWTGLVSEVPQQVVQAFAEMYPEIKEDVNASGIFYNEDSQNGYVIIGETDGPLHLYCTRHAYILGKAHVVLHATAHATALCDGCTVELLDSSTATVDKGYGIAKGHSTLTTKQNAECCQAAKVRITDATLTDNGHTAVYAYGNAKIMSFTDKGINLYDSSTLEITNE